MQLINNSNNNQGSYWPRAKPTASHEWTQGPYITWRLSHPKWRFWTRHMRPIATMCIVQLLLQTNLVGCKYLKQNLRIGISQAKADLNIKRSQVVPTSSLHIVLQSLRSRVALVKEITNGWSLYQRVTCSQDKLKQTAQCSWILKVIKIA